ncbi:hypothetical protein IPJ91_03355 [bacterium]|nr:MAG: hypothetical protein IPJ91_03355 [bacterium]
MKNYLIKYSNYFLTLGAIFLLMYFLKLVPRRFDNVPEIVRWLTPLVFIMVGVAGKFLKKA